MPLCNGTCSKSECRMNHEICKCCECYIPSHVPSHVPSHQMPDNDWGCCREHDLQLAEMDEYERKWAKMWIRRCYIDRDIPFCCILSLEHLLANQMP